MSLASFPGLLIFVLRFAFSRIHGNRSTSVYYTENKLKHFHVLYTNRRIRGLGTRLECPPIFIAPAKLLVALYSNLVLELHVGIVTK